MDFQIRKMQIKDITQVQDVAKTSWNATYKDIIPFQVQESFLRMAYSEGMLLKRLNNSLFLVSEFKGEIVGFANFYSEKNQEKVELAAIYFYPDYQGKGMGSALLQAGIASITGVNKIYVNVEKENEVGLRFYRAKGFEIIEEFDDDFDGHILKTVRMVLNVGS